jgi:hypothetical protein
MLKNKIMGEVCKVLKGQSVLTHPADSLGAASQHLLTMVQALLARSPDDIILSIKSGNLVDSYGLIPLALHCCDYFVVPFDGTIFATSSPVPASLIPATFNASLAALQPIASQALVDGAYVDCVTYVLSGNDIEDLNNTVRFEMPSTAAGLLTFPLLCLVIILSVDIRNGTLNVLAADESVASPEDLGHFAAISPTNIHRFAYRELIKKSKVTEKMMFAKGNMNLPSVFSYSAASPALPYYCGENVGEGVNEMKVRRTVKRKSQARL